MSATGKGENKQEGHRLGGKGDRAIRRVVVEHARVGVAPYSSYSSRQGFLSTTNCRCKRFSGTCCKISRRSPGAYACIRAVSYAIFIGTKPIPLNTTLVRIIARKRKKKWRYRSLNNTGPDERKRKKEK